MQCSRRARRRRPVPPDRRAVPAGSRSARGSGRSTARHWPRETATLMRFRLEQEFHPARSFGRGGHGHGHDHDGRFLALEFVDRAHPDAGEIRRRRAPNGSAGPGRCRRPPPGCRRRPAAAAALRRLRARAGPHAGGPARRTSAASSGDDVALPLCGHVDALDSGRNALQTAAGPRPARIASRPVVGQVGDGPAEVRMHPPRVGEEVAQLRRQAWHGRRRASPGPTRPPARGACPGVTCGSCCGSPSSSSRLGGPGHGQRVGQRELAGLVDDQQVQRAWPGPLEPVMVHAVPPTSAPPGDRAAGVTSAVLRLGHGKVMVVRSRFLATAPGDPGLCRWPRAACSPPRHATGRPRRPSSRAPPAGR